MIQKIKEHLKRKRGFSFIETLVCVTIIGLLAVVNLSSSAKYVDESRVSRVRAEVATLEIALAKYNREYVTEKITDSTNFNTAMNTLKSKGYIDALPSYNTSEYNCSYGWKTVNSHLHIKVTNCSFADVEISVY